MMGNVLKGGALAAAAILLVSVQVFAISPVDVTVPGDPTIAVGSGGSPGAEVVSHAIDNLAEKYLRFQPPLPVGLIVTPAMGATIVTGIRIYVANDAEERDPSAFSLEGSNAGTGGPFFTINAGGLSLPSTRNPSSGPLGANFQTIFFANTNAYTTYRVLFPTVKNAPGAANSAQIGEIELLGVAAPPCGTLLDLISPNRFAWQDPRRFDGGLPSWNPLAIDFRSL